MSPGAKKVLRVGLLAAGLAVLVGMFAYEGFGEMWTRISRVGFAVFGLMMLLSFFWNFCSTLGWWFILDSPKPVSFGKLFFIRWVGESINTVTPLMNLGGEPVKMVMMRRHMEAPSAAATVIVDKTLFSIARVFHMVTGVIVGLYVFDLPQQVQWIEFLLTGVLVAAVVMLVTLIRRGKTLTSVLGWGERLGIRLKPETAEKAGRIDDEISAFYRSHRGRFWLAVSAHFTGRASRMFDLTLIGIAFGVTMSPLAAYAIAAATVIVNTSFSFIPQQVGANEGGHAVLFKAVGLGWKDGLSSGVVRRVRTIVFSLMGYTALTVYQGFAPAEEKQALGAASHGVEP